MNSISKTVFAYLISMLMSFSVAHAAEFMSVSTAAKQSKAGEIYLVDICRPSEWKKTGVAKHAAKITMHQQGFLDRIAKHTKGDKAAPVALICATGIRSTKNDQPA